MLGAASCRGQIRGAGNHQIPFMFFFSVLGLAEKIHNGRILGCGLFLAISMKESWHAYCVHMGEV